MSFSPPVGGRSRQTNADALERLRSQKELREQKQQQRQEQKKKPVVKNGWMVKKGAKVLIHHFHFTHLSLFVHT